VPSSWALNVKANDPIKYREQLTQWHSVTSQKTWVCSNTTGRAWNFTVPGLLSKRNVCLYHFCLWCAILEEHGSAELQTIVPHMYKLCYWSDKQPYVHDCNLFTVGAFQRRFRLPAVILLMLCTHLLSGPFEGLQFMQCVVLQAAHYIGLNCNVVLCVQHLPDDAIIGSEKVRRTFYSYSKCSLCK
jgi:hypothetical protein